MAIVQLNPMAALPETLRRQLTQSLPQYRVSRYLTEHPPTQAMLRNALLIARSEHPVLITGPSGTGKELVARVMLGDRPDTEFFPVNCAGLVDTLFESLLFGHKRGSFTGADQDRLGLIVQSKTGVVFFDEIGELPLSQQAKLLRVLETRRVLPVGAAIEVPINCRFVFATNRDLKTWVKNYMAGATTAAFREDLYYRIAALELETYPLFIRPGDAQLIMQTAQPDPRLQCEVPQHVLQSPGNVRALKNWLLQREVFGIGNDGINPAIGNNATHESC
jgi:transcriptional regulator with PAS, ATPase and Fis domain